jgi:hypothetical protein
MTWLSWWIILPFTIICIFASLGISIYKFISNNNKTCLQPNIRVDKQVLAYWIVHPRYNLRVEIPNEAKIQMLVNGKMIHQLSQVIGIEPQRIESITPIGFVA